MFYVLISCVSTFVPELMPSSFLTVLCSEYSTELASLMCVQCSILLDKQLDVGFNNTKYVVILLKGINERVHVYSSYH